MGHPQHTLPSTPVRDSVSQFVPHLEYVDIDRDAIRAVAEQLATDEFTLPRWNAPVFPSTDNQGVTPSQVIDFIFLGNSINFQFRDFDSGEKFQADYLGESWRGAFGMWACLKREFDKNPDILHGSALAHLTLDDVASLFQSSNGMDIPMLEERHEILNEVGDRLVDRFDGRFSNLVRHASPAVYDGGSGIVDHLITEFPSFDDRSTVQTPDGSQREVIFWKRAQLAVAMAYGRFISRRDEFDINDPASLTIFADYNLPNVLRGFDVLNYSQELSDLIDSRTPLPAGSKQEVELRAATIVASDELMQQLNRHRNSPVYAPHLDYKLFSLRDEIDTPIHLTHTTAY